MASTESVWGIDIGQCALKALKLVSVQGQIHIEAFEIIEHPQVLSQLEPNERNQAVNAALEQFLARNDIAGSQVVISVPGQSGFTRFVKLPPVEEKQVPEIVRFEAEQQIPFGIDEVIWRWQSFRDPDSPDIEVGIFAMKRADVWETLRRFEDTGIVVDVVQMAPLSLYNYLSYDIPAEEKGATLLVDVGAEKTDLVVSDGSRIWTRTLQLGGSNFTEALVKAFKLPFAKAEKLKRSAGTSKYARQIFQAMRPVFAELVQEIQRSIGYYTSLHRESKFRRVVGLGNGFRLPGLQKYLEQNLGVSVMRVDGYEKLSPSPAGNAPAFTENVLSFAVAYGLALQGLGLTSIRTNLLPSESARRRIWDRKKPLFAAAAAMILVSLVIFAWRAYADARVLKTPGPGLNDCKAFVNDYKKLKSEFRSYDGLDEGEKKKIVQYEEMMGYRNFVPATLALVSKAIGEVAQDQPLMTVDGRERLMQIGRTKRRVIVVDLLDMKKYNEDLSAIDESQLKAGYSGAIAVARPGAVAGGGGFGGGMEMERERFGGRGGYSPVASGTAVAGASDTKVADGKRGYMLYMSGSTPLPYDDAARFVDRLRYKLGELSGEFPSIEVTQSVIVEVKRGQPMAAEPSAGGAGMSGPMGSDERGRMGGSLSSGRDSSMIVDPLTGEYAGADTQFVLGWKIVIKDDGLPKSDQAKAASTDGAE